jgi:hypothetical protein
MWRSVRRPVFKITIFRAACYGTGKSEGDMRSRSFVILTNIHAQMLLMTREHQHTISTPAIPPEIVKV